MRPLRAQGAAAGRALDGTDSAPLLPRFPSRQRNGPCRRRSGRAGALNDARKATAASRKRCNRCRLMESSFMRPSSALKNLATASLSTSQVALRRAFRASRP